MISIDINLLSPEAKKQRRARAQASRITSLSVFLVLATGAIIVLGFVAQIALGQFFQITKRDIDATKQRITQFSKIQDQVVFIHDRLGEIDRLTKQRLLYSDILSQLASSTPQSVSYTSLTIDQATKPNVKFTGTAATRRDVVKFTEKLNVSDTFGDAQFETSSLSQAEGQPTAITFTISANLKSGKTAKTKEQK